MRVIAGRYKSRKLLAPAGLSVRPTSDRLRETLFNIIASRIEGSSFLDICAGAGSVGIEALSRGASLVVMIESSRRASSAIAENLRSLGVNEGIEVVTRDAISALKRLDEENQKFDIVFFDPPYASGLYSSVLSLLAQSSLLDREAIVIVEHRSKDRTQDAYDNLRVFRRLKQGETSLAFYQKTDG